ncbi:DUF962-domain-containing protein [Trametes coccinea BRFM310]|uniref:DUF962-domain-containing protein n=1 Tax=Trametes coccinea (strain BRFM310) TaxID=1353009 RepID=A0A1Y2IC48_TRAC3|nr:DUF962-domain-containing protein [Trametes coccinea BRFM310]
MAPSDLFDVKKQLTFYGAYHHHPVNIAIHTIFVPLILWSSLVMASRLPVPSFFPDIHVVFSKHFAFDFNWPALWVFTTLAYYYVLEPTAALLYTPEMLLIASSAAAFSRQPDNFKTALALHVASWLFQFLGHGAAERRSPALLDNLLGALVLAPFFVHLEILFLLGYKPSLRDGIEQGVQAELAKIKAAEAASKKKAQ